jgi:hypothetical protein
MFGITNKEKTLLLSIIADRDKQIAKFEKQLEIERARAEAAINLLLARTVHAVLTPSTPETDAERDKREEAMFGLFGTEDETGLTKKEQEKILSDIQTLRTP